MSGRAPTLRKICCGFEDVVADAHCGGRFECDAVPGKTVQFSVPCAMPTFNPGLRDLPTTASLRALTARRSTATGAAWKPKSPPRRARCAACALATMVLVGVHPVLTQVPPKSLRSTMATLASGGETHCERRACLACSNNDGVKGLLHAGPRGEWDRGRKRGVKQNGNPLAPGRFLEWVDGVGSVISDTPVCGRTGKSESSFFPFA